MLLGQQVLPRYVRLNTLKDTSEAILKRMEEEGFSERDYEEMCSCGCLKQNQEASTYVCMYVQRVYVCTYMHACL